MAEEKRSFRDAWGELKRSWRQLILVCSTPRDELINIAPQILATPEAQRQFLRYVKLRKAGRDVIKRAESGR